MTKGAVPGVCRMFHARELNAVASSSGTLINTARAARVSVHYANRGRLGNASWHATLFEIPHKLAKVADPWVK